MPKPDDGHDAPYRYELKLEIVIGADGLDKAAGIARRVRNAVAADPGVARAGFDLWRGDLRHRNDLDGALRS